MKFVPVISLSCSILLTGCGPAPEAGSNMNSNISTANSNTAGNTRLQNVDPKDLPPGLSGSPLAPVANSAPGLNPANAVNGIPKGATPTPGIPDPATLGKPAKPGATPTPGIPDPATLKQQMEEIRKRLNSNSNQRPQLPPPTNPGPVIRKQRRIANANNQ